MRGGALARLNRLEQSIPDFDKAIKLDPSYTAAYFNRGHANRLKGDKAAAIRDFEKALEVAPPDWPGKGATEKVLEDLRKNP